MEPQEFRRQLSIRINDLEKTQKDFEQCDDADDRVGIHHRIKQQQEWLGKFIADNSSQLRQMLGDSLPQVELITELYNVRQGIPFCDVCFTISWEPCPSDQPNAIPDPISEGKWMHCAHCALYESYKKEHGASNKLSRLRQVIEANKNYTHINVMAIEEIIE